MNKEHGLKFVNIYETCMVIYVIFSIEPLSNNFKHVELAPKWMTINVATYYAVLQRPRKTIDDYQLLWKLTEISAKKKTTTYFALVEKNVWKNSNRSHSRDPLQIFFCGFSRIQSN